MDTIAISETSGKTLQINNPIYENDKIIFFTLDDLKDEVYYIKVLAKINIKSEKSFVLYNPILISDIKESPPTNPDDKNNGDKSTLYAIIAVVCVVFVILVTLVIIVLIYRFKHKDLLSQVSKVSFVENNDISDNNLLK